MAIKKIVQIGDPVLKKKTREITQITKALCKILDDMKETLYDAKGVGLAAPQIGISIRACVIDAGDGYEEYLNPHIISHSEITEELQEGCLSIPGYIGLVERFTSVTVEYMNRKGKKKKKTATGLLAQALQHEIDHLEGILYIEKATSLYETEDI